MNAAEDSAVVEPQIQREPLPRYIPEHPLLVDRWFARLPISRSRAIAVIGLLLLLIPAILAYQGNQSDLTLLIQDYRAQFIYPLILVFLLMSIPVLERGSERVVQALRPVTKLDDRAFRRVVEQASSVDPRMELLSFGIGMAIGSTINILFEPLQENASLLDIYAYLSRVGIFGVLGWTAYALSFGIRVVNAVLRQPIDVDPFNLAPFEPIGRQSLLLALTVLGGAVLSLLSASIYNRSLWTQYIVLYGVAMVSIFVLFFWSMRVVHQLLAATKRQHLNGVERNIARAYGGLQVQIASGAETLDVATELNALVAAKQQLREMRTWPFDTETLSTLSVAVLTPLFVGLARILSLFLGS